MDGVYTIHKYFHLSVNITQYQAFHFQVPHSTVQTHYGVRDQYRNYNPQMTLQHDSFNFVNWYWFNKCEKMLLIFISFDSKHW